MRRAPKSSTAAIASLCPGFIDTHFHLWGSFARGVVADGDFDYFPVMSKFGPVMTPEDAYASARLGITEAIYSGLTTIHDWSHNIIDGRYADADLRALRDCGIRARFSYGYSRNLQLKPKETADFNDIARVKREWFGASNDGLLTMGFASRGAGDTPPEVYRKEWEYARSLGLPITQHAGRSLAEIKRFRRIEMLYNDKLLGPDVQLIHTYSASEEERAMMAETKVHNSIAPVHRLALGLGPALPRRFVETRRAVQLVGGHDDGGRQRRHVQHHAPDAAAQSPALDGRDGSAAAAESWNWPPSTAPRTSASPTAPAR